MRYNKMTLLASVAGGLLSFLACIRLFSVLNTSVPTVVLIPLFFGILFAITFGLVALSARLTGASEYSFNFFKAFALGMAVVMAVGAGLEALYEFEPPVIMIKPTSFVFVIDDSGSMSGNDPDGRRFSAITEIMEEEAGETPYMVYCFSNDTELVREMKPLSEDDEEVCGSSNGGTSIRGALKQVLSDYEDGVWKGGKNPRVLLLTDGYATDMGWWIFDLGASKDFENTLHKLHNNNITVSTVGLGNTDAAMMSNIASSTGGTFINIDSATDLAAAMKTAVFSQGKRTLLSARQLPRRDWLYALMRVLFLLLIGMLLGGSMALAYDQWDSVSTILKTSLLEAAVGGLLMEVGLKMGIPQQMLWLVLWLLLSLTLGLLMPIGGEMRHNIPLGRGESCLRDS